MTARQCERGQNQYFKLQKIYTAAQLNNTNKDNVNDKSIDIADEAPARPSHASAFNSL